MEPMTMLLGTLATLAVKSAIQQGAPSDSDWGSAAGSVLSALLEAHAETDDTLRRVEEKLETLAVDRYRHPLAAAVRHLGDAQEAWRTPDQRERLLEQARYRLIDAAVAAPDGAIRATVEWHLALAWLLSGSTNDCWGALTRARNESFGALCSATRDWSGRPAPAGRRPVNRINALRHTQMGAKFAPALDFLKVPPDQSEGLQAATSAIDAALAVTGTVQDIRCALGAPRASCQKPQVAPYPLPGLNAEARPTLRPVVTVDLHTGANDVWGTLITIHEVRQPRHVAREWWTVDVRLTLMPMSDGGEVQVLSVARIEDLYYDDSHLTEAPVNSFTDDQVPPPATTGTGVDRSTAREGWITSLSRGRPTLIGIRDRFVLNQVAENMVPREGVISLFPLPLQLTQA